VFAKVMRSKEGVFEGVSFIKSKDKASVLTIERPTRPLPGPTEKAQRQRVRHQNHLPRPVGCRLSLLAPLGQRLSAAGRMKLRDGSLD
jgi:hypothetical protein